MDAEPQEESAGQDAPVLQSPPTGPDTLGREYKRIRETRLENVVWVDQPLALISQLPRSGGTLLTRLFDGHPECHSVPHELHPTWEVGDDPADLDRVWTRFADKSLVKYFGRGFV
jgi:hypothetical protein